MFTTAKDRLKVALFVVFCIFNALFFYGIFFQLASMGSFYDSILRSHGRVLILFSSFVLGTCSLLLPLVYRKNAEIRAWYRSSLGEFTQALDQHSPSSANLWIIVTSGQIMFIELCIIRWVASLVPELSAYRNFALMGCFLGIGLGYMRGGKKPTFLPFLLPLVGLQFLQLSMISLFYPAMHPPRNLLWILARAPLWQLVLIIVVTIAPGELVGRLLSRSRALRAYGANLLGSILGVVAFNLSAALWLPPWAWLLEMAFTYLFIFHRLKGFIHGLSIFLTLVGLAYLLGPPSVLEIYSPYQRISLRSSGLGHRLGDGRIAIFSNDLYYQSFSMVDTNKLISDLDVQHRIPNADLTPVLRDLKGKKVLALGSGAGANIPSLLAAGVSSVVAVDIDPTIVHLGKMLNANYPYWDPRVRVVVDDARAFMNVSSEMFDYILFLWIDSNPYVTSSTGFRVDSFVYTRECFEQVERRLNPGGRVLVYAWMNDLSARRIFLTLREVFSTHIYCFKVMPYGYQGLYVVSPDPVGNEGSQFVVPWDVNASEGGSLRILTDDWPFLYLAGDSRGVLRLVLFLLMVLSVSVISIYLNTDGAVFARARETNLLVFFLFGFAFMLMETTIIMRVALLMGNTWRVTGYVIVAILAMAYVGNCLVARDVIIRKIGVVVGGLLGSLVLCWAIDARRFGSLWGYGVGVVCLYLVLLSLPVVFSSILFSLFIRDHPQIDQALGINLLGSMCGGCAEYAAMIYGYRSLALLIPLIYLVAFAISLANKPRIAGGTLHDSHF
ncbi:MAG: methyltransferase domain-containing protein [Acidobacteriota bacterium]